MIKTLFISARRGSEEAYIIAQSAEGSGKFKET